MNSNRYWENPKNILDRVIQIYNIINNIHLYNKNSRQPISIDDLKNMYKTFYAGYHWLMTNKKISSKEISDLIGKKQKLDRFFNQNLPNKKKEINYKKNTEENIMLLIHKKLANRIPTNMVNALAHNLHNLKLNKNK